MKNNKLLVALSGLVVLMLQTQASFAGTAGYVQFVNGRVSVTTVSGDTRTLQKGEAINEGDTINTSQSSSAQIKMQDGGFIAVRPDTQLKFDTFKMAVKPGQPESSVFSLFKGGFRAVTGLIGRVNKQDYRIKTPAATIGIRGSDHETAVVTKDLPGTPAGTYSKVNVGATSVTTNKGTVIVQPNQMGYAGSIHSMPAIKPVNLEIFVVAEKPNKTVKQSKEENKESKKQQTAKQQSENEKSGNKNKSDKPEGVANNQQVATSDKTEGSTPAQNQRSASEARNDAPPSASEPIRETATVDNTKLPAGISTGITMPVAAPSTTAEKEAIAPLTPPAAVLPVKSSNGALTLDNTTQTVTSGGTTVSVQNGIYATQAQTAADAATVAAAAANTAKVAAVNAVNTLRAITPVNTTAATTAVASANSAISTATPLVTSANTLTAANLGTTASTAQSSTTTAATQATAANTAFSASGLFADSTAAPANTAVQSANTALQAANITLQTAATTATTQNTTLVSAKTAATTALASANTNFSTATGSLTAANTQNSTISTATSNATTLLNEANAAAAASQAAATAAQAAAAQAATLQSAGDLTGAAAQMAIAQQKQADAKAQLVLVQNANASLASSLATAQAAQKAATSAVTNATSAATTAATAATTAQTQASAASTAATAATAALATVTSQSAVVSSNAITVANNAPIAAYKNPAVVTANRFVGVLSTVVAPTTGQYIEGYGPGAAFTGTGTANTSYVLDGTGNLVESRHTWYEETPASTSTPQVVIPDANVKRTGGTAAAGETFKLSDNSIYAGRWVGGTITVTDNAAVVSPITRNLGATSEHWAILLAPSAGYLQALSGTTTYNKVAATSPTDGLGNAGVLNTASLSANFTTQLVNAALNLTITGKTLDVVANSMAISGSGFGTATQVTATCTGTGCATYYANVGGMFAGDAAASVGMSYSLWTGASPGATTPASDLIQGLAAFTTATAPTLQVFDVAAATAATAAQTAATAAAAAATAAATSNSTLTSIALADAALASARAASVQTTTSTVVSQATAAQTAVTSNSTFADSTAITANTNIQTAKTTAQTANTTVQAAPAIISTQNTAIATAQGAGSTSLTAAQAAAANALIAANAAQAAATSAATLQAGGDLVGAQAQMVIAQQQLAIAQTEQTNALNAKNALDAQLVAAQTAATNAAAALVQTDVTVVSSPANIVQTNAGIVTNNAPLAAYKNPAVASSNFQGHYTMSVPVTGGFHYSQENDNIGHPQTSYVLDGGGNLVEMRSSSYDVGPMLSAPTTHIVNADVKWIGGTAADTFKLPDNSMYGGRWVGATVMVTDLSNSSQYFLTPANSLWAVLQTPNNGYVGSLIGTTNYTMASATLPFDTAGNTGTLTNATLSADFTSQLVKATLNLIMPGGTMAGTYAITANNFIDGAGGFGGNTVPTVTCSVGACAAGAGGYSANVGGSFAGAGAASAGLGYDIWPTVSPGFPVSNLVQGLVALTTGTAPSVLTNPAAGLWSAWAQPTVNVGSVGPYQRGVLSTATPIAQTNFVLDGAGNLVKALHAGYREQATYSISPATSVYTDATIAFSGGTPNDYYMLPDGSNAIGRWTGGTMTVTDNISTLPTLAINLGTNSVPWSIGQPTSDTYVQKLIGSTTYTQRGATLPTDSFGNVGTTPVATLTANFSLQTVNASVAFTIANQSLTTTATNMPFAMNASNQSIAGSFYARSESANAPTVTCTGLGCGVGYTARLIGGFDGAVAASAEFDYTIWPTAPAGSLVSDIIQGIVVFDTATAPLTAVNPVSGSYIAALTTMSASGFFSGMGAMSETGILLNGAGNLVRLQNTGLQSNGVTVMTNAYTTWAGGTAFDRFQTADGALTIGRWQGSTLTATDLNQVDPTTYMPSANSLWFYGNTPGSTAVLIGTSNYTKVGNTTPMGMTGNGTLNTVGTSLSVDFTNQLVSAAVDVTMNGGTYNGANFVLANNALPLYADGSFAANGESNTNGVTCTVNCGSTLWSGDLSGSLVGTSVSDAVLLYLIHANDNTEFIQGLVAFNTVTAPTIGVNPPAGLWESFSHLPVGGTGAWTRGRFNIGANPVQPETSFVLDGAGNLVRSIHVGYNERPVYGGTGSNGFSYATITYSGGVASDLYTTPDGSLTIGRWTGGKMTVTDNLGINPTLVSNLGLTSAYWGLGSASMMPAGYIQNLTGTTTYSLAGATAPTDTFGNAGTVTAATLTANFGNQTVDASVAFTIALQDLTISATGVPIMAGIPNSYFDATLELGTAPTVSCTGSCSGGGYLGWMTGAFNGATAQSADLSYKIWPTATQGATVTDIIQGIVALYAGTAPTVSPYLAYNYNHIAVEVAGGGTFNIGSGKMAAAADLVYSGGGLTGATFRSFGGDSWQQGFQLTGGTPSFANAANGIQYGKWTGYTGDANTWSQALGGKGGGTPSTWMYGAEGYVDAAYLSGPNMIGAMAGSFSYQLDGATAPTSQNSGLKGTLTSATVTADFTTMLVNATLGLNMYGGNEQWAASMTNQTINGNRISGPLTVTYGLGIAPATCTTCGGTLNGMFTGQNYAGIILNYNVYNNPVNSSENISGEVALSRNYAGNANPVVTNGTAAPTGNTVVANGYYNNVQTSSITTSGTLLTGYTNGGGNFNWSTAVTSCTTCTTNASGQVATSGIYYGTWDAGTYTSSYSGTFTAGSKAPSYWITGPEAGPLYLSQALTGTATYSFNSGMVGNSMGTTGTVLGTTALTLDFAKQAVGINLDVSIAATNSVVHTWKAATTPGNEAALGGGMGINGATFNASTFNNGNGSGILTVTVDGGTTPITVGSANINGQLTGAGLNGAIMSFDLNGTLNPGATPTYENISGVAALTGATQAIATSHRYVWMSFYEPFSVIPQPLIGLYANNETHVLQDVAGLNGNLTKFDSKFILNNGGPNTMTFAQGSSTLLNQGSDVTSGISWGRWSGGTMNATDQITGVVTSVTQAGSMHWIAESATSSATSLPTSGTFTYINAGGTTPTNSAGVAGTLNSATLTANFTAMTVNMGVNVTVAGATLNATAVAAPIIQKTLFYASANDPAGTASYLNVTCSGTCDPAVGGVVMGKFVGAGAIGAAMTYGLQNGASTISGVTAFHQ